MTGVCLVTGFVGLIGNTNLNNKSFEKYEKTKKNLLQILKIDLKGNVNRMPLNEDSKKQITDEIDALICEVEKKKADGENKLIMQKKSDEIMRKLAEITLKREDSAINYAKCSQNAIKQFCKEFHKFGKITVWKHYKALLIFLLYFFITVTVLLLDGGMMYTTCFNFEYGKRGCGKS